MHPEVLDRARSGDEQAFGELVEPYRSELRLHCYRMLGSLTDAEDVLQETLLAAWRGLAGFEGRSSVRTWLYRVATNRCLNAIRDAARRPPPAPVPPFEPPEPTRRDEVTWLQPYPDRLLPGPASSDADPQQRWEDRETVELAFVAGLQRLPPRQAATLILCDVLGYSVTEAGDLLDTGATAVKGALQRARATMSRQAGATDPPRKAGQDDLAARFADAFVRRDLDALVALLTQDAWLAMPPAPHVYVGVRAIREFLTVSGTWRGDRELVLRPTRANTQPAFAAYLREPGAGTAHGAGVLVLSVRDARVHGITRFLDPRVLACFGPTELT